MQGAQLADSGHWTCEVGGRGAGGELWALEGEVDIRVVRAETGESGGLTGAIQVNIKIWGSLFCVL